MDDVDAARELLDEVIRDGNQEQKEEAESILNGIG
jgi:pilus assembly protein FimV